MFRAFLTGFFAVIVFSSFAQTPAADDILKTAYKQAATEKKNVLVIFHASWCVWCHRMDASLNDPSVKKFFDKNYVITHLVVNESKGKEHLENPGAADFLDKMGGKNEGLPYWVVLDASGEKLADSQMGPGENTGCPANEKEVAHFRIVLKNTSTLNNEELDAIAKRFRKNE